MSGESPPPESDRAGEESAGRSKVPCSHNHTGGLVDLTILANQLGVSVTALEALGVTRDGPAWRIPERDADGRIVGYATRGDDGRKSFVTGGRRGLTMSWPIPTYAGTSANDAILVPEGMSDAAAALSMSFFAIGRPSATGGLSYLRELVKDRYVVVVGENDRAGKAGAEKIGQGMVGVAAEVKIIFPPDGAKDLREWFIAPAPCDRAEVLAVIRAAEPLSADAVDDDGRLRTLAIRVLADVQPEVVQWVWKNRIARGKLTLLVGDPGLGKSLLTLDVAARVSTGSGWPDAPRDGCEPGGVLLIGAEDGLADTVRPRLDAAGADVRRIAALEGIAVTDPESGDRFVSPVTLADVEMIGRAICDIPGCALVVIDPVSAFLGEADSHNNAEVRAALSPLTALAERTGVAIVMVTHLRKGEGAAIYRAMGSLGFAAASRSAWVVSKDDGDSTGRRRLLLSLKANLAPDVAGLAFTIEDRGSGPCVSWCDGSVDISADDAVAHPRGRPGPAADERDEAVAWLKAALAEGPRLAKEVQEEAHHAAGISSGTLRRAQRDAGVVAYRPENPGPWWWRLP